MAGSKTLTELARITKLMDDTRVKRDKLIVKARGEGAGASEVARVAALTRGRIYQIEDKAK